MKRFFSFDIYSFLNRKAIDVGRSVLFDMIMPAPGLPNDGVEVDDVEAPPKKNS